jgi:DNA polymerase III alpha subunit
MFTHLHVASGYSARYGASLPDALVARAAEQKLGALALTDRDTVAGAVRFAQACAASGIRPLFGADLAVPLLGTGGSGQCGSGSGAGERRRSPARGGAFVDESAPRVTLLARDWTGWANLCALITAGWAAWDPLNRALIIDTATVNQHRKIRRHAAVTGRFPIAVLSDCTVYPAPGPSALDLLRAPDGTLTSVWRLGISPGLCKHEGTQTMDWALELIADDTNPGRHIKGGDAVAEGE